jgi:hypothetical protein
VYIILLCNTNGIKEEKENIGEYMYSPILETLFATPSLPLFFRKEGIKKSTKWFVSGSRHYSWEKVNSHKKI